MEKRIVVKDVIHTDTAVSTDMGDAVFKQIIAVISGDNCVILDFVGIEILTTAFLNAAIGQLYSQFSSEQLNKMLQLTNVAEDDKILFKKVISRAKEYFKNKTDFEDSANKAIYGS